MLSNVENNQRKTVHQIAHEARITFRDIVAILKKRQQ